MLNRHNEGKIQLDEDEKELLAMQSKRLGEKFNVESKPFSKGAFDFADMAAFSLLPNKWRPRSAGQDLYGETGYDKFAGGVGSVAGLATGVGAAAIGTKIGWNALKKAFLKRKSDDIASNVYKGNLLGPGGGPPLQIGQGNPLSLAGRPGVPQLPGGGRYPVQTTPNVGNVGRQLEEQRRRLDEAIAALRSNPYAQSMGIQQGGYIPGYQEGNYVEPREFRRGYGLPDVYHGYMKDGVYNEYPQSGGAFIEEGARNILSGRAEAGDEFEGIGDIVSWVQTLKNQKGPQKVQEPPPMTGY